MLMMAKEKKFKAQTVRIPKELEKSIGHLLVDKSESFQGLVLRLLRAALAAPSTESVEHGISGDIQNAPTKERLVKELSEDVQLLLNDPWIAECLLQLGEIRRSGDADIMDSMQRNARTFARMSRMVIERANAIEQRNKGNQNAHEQRASAFFEAAKRVDEGATADADKTETPGGGGKRNEPVGDKPVREAGGGGKK